MPQYDDELHMQEQDGVLYAGNGRRIRNVSGDTDHEKFSDPGVEYELRDDTPSQRNPQRSQTAVGHLRVPLAGFGVLKFAIAFVFYKASVSFDQFVEGVG